MFLTRLIFAIGAFLLIFFLASLFAGIRVKIFTQPTKKEG